MKKLCLLLLAVLMILSMSACGTPKEENTESGTAPTETTPEKIDINVAVLSGPTGMGAASLMDKAAQNETANNYHFTVAASPDEITASIINGEFKIACVPTNLAAVLYKKPLD